MEKILVTGGAGFIGSNFIPYFLEENPTLEVINLDKLTYAGNIDHLAEVAHNERYCFVKGDICDTSLVKDIFAGHDIGGIIHFAAESHVDNSIENPHSFIKTNIRGTFNLLEMAKKAWLDRPNELKSAYKNARFHHISTDEVYGSLGEEGFFDENTPYAPNSPYSASKAASDFLVRSYHHTYGLPVVTTNCSNNFGPKQHNEKLIPTIIRNALKGNPIPIYGDGKNVRDWLYVTDHCKGIDLVFKKGKIGETYAFGGANEYDNLHIAQKICRILDELEPKLDGKYEDQIVFTDDRLGHDRRYAINFDKIKTELGWVPKTDFNEGIRKTILWYLNKYQKV